MKEKRNVHLKVQELCDCYSTTDLLKEMSVIKDDADTEEAALKWIALAALHGINDNADSISITRTSDGATTVTAKYRNTDLPSPGPTVGKNIIDAVREMTHLEGKKGKVPFSLGIRESSVDLTIKVKEKEDKERISIKFPK